MKVVILGCTPPPVGGIAEWTMRMLNSQLKNGWEIVLVDDKMIGGREAFGEGTKKNYFIEGKRCIRYWRKLKKALVDPEAKVVHSCPIASITSMMKEYVCARIVHRRNRAFISHFRCTVPNMISNERSKKMLIKFCDECDYIMALNKQTADYLSEITDTPISVIPNFVEEKEIVETKMISRDLKTALYVGGVIEEKGCMEIIELAKKFVNIEFRMVGRASDEIEEEAEKLPNVVLTGVKGRDELKEEYANADLFLFLSHFKGEGFSNALAEAMGAGLPCIVTNWAANADMIDDNLGGFVVECGATQKLEQVMERAMNFETRNQQSVYNINKIKEKYSKEYVLGRYVDVYEKCL